MNEKAAWRIDPMTENKLTPEIIEAANKVEAGENMNGYGPWELMGLCSRDHARKLEEASRRCRMGLCEGAAVAGAVATNYRTNLTKQIEDAEARAARYRAALEYIASDVFCFSLEKATQAAKEALK